MSSSTPLKVAERSKYQALSKLGTGPCLISTWAGPPLFSLVPSPPPPTASQPTPNMVTVECFHCGNLPSRFFIQAILVSCMRSWNDRQQSGGIQRRRTRLLIPHHLSNWIFGEWLMAKAALGGKQLHHHREMSHRDPILLPLGNESKEFNLG